MANKAARQGAPEGRNAPSYTGFNPRVELEQPMLIVADNSDLADFCDSMFGYIEASLEARGGRIEMDAQDFHKYCATAIKVRVEQVNRPRWRRLGYEYTGMTVTEGWALPTPMHDVISSIGETRVHSTETLVYPVWKSSADELVIDKERRDFITRQLRSACSTLGLSVHDAISKDVDGHHQMMILIYLPDVQEWWTRTPTTREDAAASMVLGSKPVRNVRRERGGAVYEDVDLEPLATALTQLPVWMPDLRMERQVVVRYLSELAKLTG